MSLVGIGGNMRKNAFLGLLAGFGFIFLAFIGVFSFALPPTEGFSTNLGRFLVVLLIAPIIEEGIFRGAALSLLREKLGFFSANIVQATVFGLFHLFAYSGVLLETFSFGPAVAVGGAFASAIIFGLVAGILAEGTKSLLTPMTAHFAVNLAVVAGLLVVAA